MRYLLYFTLLIEFPLDAVVQITYTLFCAAIACEFGQKTTLMYALIAYDAAAGGSLLTYVVLHKQDKSAHYDFDNMKK